VGSGRPADADPATVRGHPGTQLEATVSAFISDDELAARIVDAADQIDTLRAGMVGPLRDLQRRDSPHLNRALRAAQRGGSRLHELGAVLGLSPQAVFHRIKNGAQPPRPAPRLLTDAETAELLRAHAAADARNPAKDDATSTYRQLLRQHVDTGATQSYLARLLGVTPAAVRFQLRRADRS
jgi:hypothetical protein